MSYFYSCAPSPLSPCRLPHLLEDPRCVVHGRKALEVVWNLRQELPLRPRGPRGGQAEGKVVDGVGKVRHGGVEVVVDGAGLDVEVARDAVHHEVARDLALGVVGAAMDVGGGRGLLIVSPLLSLLLPVLELLRRLELASREGVERVHGAVGLVVRLHGVAVGEPPEGGESVDLLGGAQLGLRGWIRVRVSRRS